MIGIGMHFFVLNFFCYEIDISTDMSKDQVSEERDPELNEEEDIRMDEIRDKNWRGVAEEGDNKKKFHALMWEVYVKVR